MKLKKFLLILLIISLFWFKDVYAHSGGSYFKYGVGILDPEIEHWNNIKLFELGYQDDLVSVLDYQMSAGVWVDQVPYLGRKSSGYLSWSPGISVTGDWYYLKGFWGVAILSHKDEILGGHFQFKNDLEVGLKDKRGVKIGGCYTHVSSAGIFSPNIGRDFGTVKLQIPF